MPYKDKQKLYENVRKWKREHAEHDSNYMKKYRASHKKEIKEYFKKHVSKDPVQFKFKKFERRLKKIYGITVEEYGSLLASQNNLCAICGTELTDTTRHLDHCHKTNKVRGFLCAGCNRSIAALDNFEWLIKAKVYLEKNS